ncbi:MAG: hypothetical protein ACNFW9_05565 [Candidatus Kerfeldbacteria bacterium]
MNKVFRSEIKAFYELVKDLKTIDGAVKFLMNRILADTSHQTDFENKIIMMMARKTPDKWSPELATEFMNQIGLLLWILGPVWVSNGESLPKITLTQFKEAITNEPANDWDEFYSEFGKHDPLWQSIIDDKLAALKMNTSRIIVGRIARIFMVNLPDHAVTH